MNRPQRGGDRDGAGPRWSRAEKLGFFLFVAGLLGSLLVLVHPWYDLTNDGSLYIITARAIAAGEGYTYLGMPFRIRSPGFPALLAPLVAGEHTPYHALNLLVSLFGVAGVVLLYLYQRPYLGWVLALFLSGAVWLNPGYQRLCNQVMSDVPGLAVILACLLLERWGSRRPSLWREGVLGLCIGAAAYVRSITILLVPAIVIARLSARLRSGSADHSWTAFGLRLVLLPLAAWLVLVPWVVFKQRNPPPTPVDQTYNYSISTAMWHRDRGDPASPRYGVGEVLSRVRLRGPEIVLTLGSRLQHRIPGSPRPTPGAVLVYAAVALMMTACLLVTLARWRRPADWFAAGTLLVLAIYFDFVDRLGLPVYVFALAATVGVLRALARRVACSATTVVPLGALLLLTVVDFEPRQDWAAIEARHHAFIDLASAVERTLEADARLAAGQGSHYGVYLKRPVYTLFHAAKRAGRLDAAEEIIDKYGINTVVLSPLVPPDVPLIPHFMQRYGAPVRAGDALVWRVRP